MKFKQFEQSSPKAIFSHLENLNAQAVAIILYHLPTAIGKEVLKQFSPFARNEIFTKVDELSPLDKEAMDALADIVSEKMNSPSSKRVPINGQKVLSQLYKNGNNSLKEIITQTVPSFAALYRKNISFEDLSKMPDNHFQRLLKDVDRRDLLLAIKTKPEKILEKIRSNMSKGALEILAIDIRDFGPAKKQDVIAAQNKILALAKEMEQKGLLVLEDKEEYI